MNTEIIKTYINGDYSVKWHNDVIYIELRKEMYNKYVFTNAHKNITKSGNYRLLNIKHYANFDINHLQEIVDYCVEILDEYIQLVKVIDLEQPLIINILPGIYELFVELSQTPNLPAGLKLLLAMKHISIKKNELKKYINFFIEHQHHPVEVKEFLTMDSINYYSTPSFPYTNFDYSKTVLSSVFNFVNGYDSYVEWFSLLRMQMLDLSFLETANMNRLEYEIKNYDSNQKYTLPMVQKDTKPLGYFDHFSRSNPLEEAAELVELYGDLKFDKVLKCVAIKRMASTYGKMLEVFQNSFINTDETAEEIYDLVNNVQTKGFILFDYLNKTDQDKVLGFFKSFYEESKIFPIEKIDSLESVSFKDIAAIYRHFGITVTISYEFSNLQERYNAIVATLIKLPEEMLDIEIVSDFMKEYEKFNYIKSTDDYIDLIDLYIDENGLIPVSICSSMLIDKDFEEPFTTD